MNDGIVHTLPNGIAIARTRPEHADQLEALQKTVFPTLSPGELFRAPHYRKHVELFPEGQFVALDGERVVGMTTAIRLDFDFEHLTHTFAEVIQGGWLTSHDPSGRWLYGADIGTHPDYRRMGIARALYAARHETVRRFGLDGQVTVGMMSGYGALRERMTPEQYFDALRTGAVQDPTVSAQVRMGFEIRALLKGYLNDPVCANCGILIVLDAATEVPFE